jgi:hypothetical protein
LGLLWVSGCTSVTGDQALAHCGVVQRNVLGIGSPLVLMLGGSERSSGRIRSGGGGRWWIWQGAGWFLLVLTMTVPVALN